MGDCRNTRSRKGIYCSNNAVVEEHTSNVASDTTGSHAGTVSSSNLEKPCKVVWGLDLALATMDLPKETSFINKVDMVYKASSHCSLSEMICWIARI